MTNSKFSGIKGAVVANRGKEMHGEIEVVSTECVVVGKMIRGRQRDRIVYVAFKAKFFEIFSNQIGNHQKIIYVVLDNVDSVKSGHIRLLTHYKHIAGIVY